VVQRLGRFCFAHVCPVLKLAGNSRRSRHACGKAAAGPPRPGALTIAGRAYASRLLVGTGKYKDMEQTRRAVEASGAQIVTVAIRRTNLGQN
ncbi:hypothetical protein Q5762_38305, partial [Streptomyces sp. P9(2023)]|nr:hypothetical protein [Streptomyces sp. P9(2023)]